MITFRTEFDRPIANRNQRGAWAFGINKARPDVCNQAECLILSGLLSECKAKIKAEMKVRQIKTATIFILP